MNILVLGAFGREHALAVAYSKSKKVKKVFVAPGNDLMDYKNPKILCCPTVSMFDSKKIISLCRKKKIDLVDVAQDDVLATGMVDILEKEGIKTFGPTKKAAQIEWDKEWARNFMVTYNLPVPTFKSFTNLKKAVQYIESRPEQLLFIKASGLYGGKGVIRADTKKEALDAIDEMKKMGKSGETFLIEDGMVGEEFSLFVLCDGENYKIFGWAQDHKTVFNGDRGPNTGGMGCISPTNALSKKDIAFIDEKILKPFMKGMQKENRPYSGILYLGGIITKKGIKIIEFNARWGDPETEVILPGFKTDYLDIVTAVKNKKLKSLKITQDKNVFVSIAACSQGYPGNHSDVTGKEIFGLEKILKLPDIQLFGSGVKRKNNRFFANGGRILHVVAKGKNIIDARKKAYEAISIMYIDGNNLHYRTDIGYRDVERILYNPKNTV